MYGPAFTLASEAHAVVVRESPGGGRLALQGAGRARVLALTALAAGLAREQAFAAAFVGWNPLLAVHFAGGGHNDAWMMASCWGAPLAASGRRQLAGVAWVGAIAIKWVALVFLPLRALEARAQGRRVGHLGFACRRGRRCRRYVALRHGWARRSGPRARTCAEGGPLQPSLATLGARRPTMPRSRSRPRSSRWRTLAAPGGVAGPRAPRPLRRSPAGRDALAGRLVRGLGGAARCGRGGQGRAAARSRALGATCFATQSPYSLAP